MRLGEVEEVVEVPRPIKAGDIFRDVPRPAPSYVPAKEFAFEYAKRKVAAGRGNDIEDDRPKCPFCNITLLKELWPEGPKGYRYLCPKHGYFNPEDVE